MAIKVYRPTTNARRQMSRVSGADITQNEPEKSLIIKLPKISGRNNSGKITIRHRGGAEKRYYRIIDFKRDKFDIPAVVTTIEYDPNRTSRIALLVYRDGEKRYIIVPADLKVGQELISSKTEARVAPGNTTTLENMPIGSLVHNIELVPGHGGEIARSAGSWAKLMAVEGAYASLRMPSSELRMVAKECLATFGQVGNAEHMHVNLGKAGRKRHMGWRPTVRGKVMNPNDHPHGGGEGRNPIGLKHPKTKWGKNAFGVHTRKPKKASDRMIISRRKKITD